jgi:hypothetical protein
MSWLIRVLVLVVLAAAIGWYIHPPLREELNALAASFGVELKAPAPEKKSARKKRRRPSSRPKRPRAPKTAAVRGVDWEVRGEVYDLLTLEPVAGAEIVFREDPTAAGKRVETDASGKFTALVPAATAKGLVVSFSHPDYDDVFLEETRAPYKRWSLDRRQDAYAEAQTAEVLHVPLFGVIGEATVYNIAALPKLK